MVRDGIFVFNAFVLILLHLSKSYIAHIFLPQPVLIFLLFTVSLFQPTSTCSNLLTELLKLGTFTSHTKGKRESPTSNSFANLTFYYIFTHNPDFKSLVASKMIYSFCCELNRHSKRKTCIYIFFNLKIKVV
jgi:hypothetical protein